MKYTAKQIEEISHEEPIEIASFITSTLRKQDRDILSSLFSVTRGEFSFK